MRLGRIASPDGVAFVGIDGDPDRPTEMTAREIAEHPFGTPTFTGRSWPLAGIERFGFYERAKQAYAVLATSERRFYGCFIFKMGVIPPE